MGKNLHEVMKNLKACPFCGHPAAFAKEAHEVKIGCSNSVCGIYFEHLAVHDWSIEYLMDRWNLRNPPIDTSLNIFKELPCSFPTDQLEP